MAGAANVWTSPDSSWPLLPPMTTLRVTRRLWFDFGGTPQANAAAARASWPQILRFTEQALDG